MIADVTAKTPDGPRGNILLGNMLEFRRDPLTFLQSAAREYGPVVRGRFANQFFYMVSDPDAVQRILQDRYRQYVKGKFFEPVRLLIGNGLASSEGAFWLRQRRLMQPEFHRQRIAAFAETMVRRADIMAHSWASAVESGKPVDVAEEMTQLTMLIIVETMFGSDGLEHQREVMSAVVRLLEEVKFRFDVPFYPPLNVPTPRNREVRVAKARLDTAMQRIVDQRRSSEPRADLLGMLLAVKDADTGEGMTDGQIRDEVVTIFVAGHETTAVLLAWAICLIAAHPEVESRVMAEFAAVLNGRLPVFEDVPRLVYTRRILDETLRLYPPAWITNRECLEEDVLCDYRIPAGAFVTFSPYVIHRLPEYWSDPEKFDPDRFLPERSGGRPKFAYLPFGGGPHQCIGNQFALTEAALVLATVLQRYSLSLPAGAEVKTSAKITLRPEGGLPMRVERRVAEVGD